MSLRWEWRTFGDRFGVAEDRFRSLEVERSQSSDETYLLSGADHAVKVRDGLMDIKQLERVDDAGLELWRPVMKAALPIAAADAQAVFAALGIAPPPLTRATYDVADIAAASTAVRLVAVHKTRRHYTVAGAMAELTDIRAGDRATRTIAVESDVPADVVAAVRELGLEGRPNVNVPRGLRELVR